MERELWAILMRAVRDVSRSQHDTAYHTHRTALIVRVYLWATLHDRPVYWACDPRQWDRATRPTTLPSQSTMSRRLRSDAVQQFLDRLGRRLAGQFAPALWLLKCIDGKPLPVAAHSQDKQARWGRGAGQMVKGYKLHVIDDGSPMPCAFEVQPLHVNEKQVARRLIPQLRGTGYLVGDANYDASDLYTAAAQRQHRLIAPRRNPRTGLGHHPQARDRLRSIALLETGPRVGNAFGQHLLRLRRQVESTFGNLTGFFAGLDTLPPWVRGLARVQRHVHAKLLINAARIRRIRA